MSQYKSSVEKFVLLRVFLFFYHELFLLPRRRCFETSGARMGRERRLFLLARARYVLRTIIDGGAFGTLDARGCCA